MQHPPHDGHGRWSPRRAAALLAAGIAFGAAGSANAPAATPAPAAAPSTAQLSDEALTTTWVTPSTLAEVHTSPSQTSRRITTLRFHTEDGYPEVYVALTSRADAAGAEWVQLRLPMRPNGRTGWVPRESLGDYHVVHTALLVDRSKLRMTLRRDGRVIWSARIGVGARRTPTPAGRFWVREKFRVHGHQPTYGPYAFGTADYSTLSDWPRGGVIGIHGTDEPGLIPGRPSHGCIRLRNADVTRLYHLMPVGTPIHVT